jgi:hypothetical protein
MQVMNDEWRNQFGGPAACASIFDPSSRADGSTHGLAFRYRAARSRACRPASISPIDLMLVKGTRSGSPIRRRSYGNADSDMFSTG